MKFVFSLVCSKFLYSKVTYFGSVDFWHKVVLPKSFKTLTTKMNMPLLAEEFSEWQPSIKFRSSLSIVLVAQCC